MAVCLPPDVVSLEGANWVRPDSLKWKWRAVVGQLATLKADHTIYLPKVTSHWPPRDRRPRLRAFVGEAQKLVTNSESPEVTAGHASG